MKALFVGDVHCEWGLLNNLINHKRPDVVIQCGDFGYWPNEKYLNSKGRYCDYWNPSLVKTPVPLYFVDGNHENHPTLREATVIDNEVAPNVFYMKRGSTLNIGNSNFLFMGGANSIDKNQRVPGRDWFPEEIISNADLDVALTVQNKVDIVVSHTCPGYILHNIPGAMLFKRDDPCYHALDIVLDKFKPRKWFFGHFHVSCEIVKNGTFFYGLSDVGGSGNFRNFMMVDI